VDNLTHSFVGAALAELALRDGATPVRRPIEAAKGGTMKYLTFIRSSESYRDTPAAASQKRKSRRVAAT
jgi:hypothetical protein